ncbi:MAG: iron uptake transporter permease EfeU [Chloroflexota bacterium]
MDIGSLSAGFLIGLREGVEAALIVSIIAAFLVKIGGSRYLPRVWLGSTAAVAVSLGAGMVLWVTIGGLEQPYEQIFEGGAMLTAAAVVTWMLFWMRRQAAGISGQLRAQVSAALDQGGTWALAVLAFTAVIREGIETSLFLVGQLASADLTAPAVLLGAAGGLLVAVLLGVGFYQGSRRLDLARFFRWTGIALVFIAAGLLSHAIHEFVEVGVVAVGTAQAFDISALLPHEGSSTAAIVGSLLRAVFGYTSTPEVVTLAIWAAYIIAVLALYLRPMGPRSGGRAEARAPAA